jgi:fucose permease
MVGLCARLPGGWRLAFGTAACTPILLRLLLRRVSPPQASTGQEAPRPARRPLPLLYWVYWSALTLAVSVEFCMTLWSADYMEKSLGMPKVDAAQAVSLFLAGMIIGRLAGSRVVHRFSTPQVVMASILVAGVGFALFWTTGQAGLGLVGLFVTGLGVASLYPMILSLTIGTANTDTDQASARATLAPGSAILVLPLLLGRLADMVGIRQAYGVVAVLLIGVFLIVLLTGSTVLARRPASGAFPSWAQSETMQLESWLGSVGAEVERDLLAWFDSHMT